MDAEAVIRDSAKHIEDLIREAGPSVKEGLEHAMRYSSICAWCVVGMCVFFIILVSVIFFLFLNYLKKSDLDSSDKFGASLFSTLFCGLVMFGCMMSISHELPTALEPSGSLIYNIINKHVKE